MSFTTGRWTSPRAGIGPAAAIGIVTFVLLASFPDQTSAKLNVTMAEFVEAILNRKGYRSNVRPGIDMGTPSIVELNIFVNSISSIDDFNMEYSMTFYLRQSWRDFRLAYSSINKTVTLNYNDINRIWVPDLFFRNEKAGMLHDITVPNRLIRLWPDGKVLYSQRVSLRLDCYMQLHKFPLDDQKCRMEIGSYGYTTEDLVFKWKDTGALSIKENLELPEFQITGTKVGDCTRVFSTGAFACVYAEFHFDRKFEYYLLQTYIPSLLIVVLSWVSFWIDIEAVPARISLGLLTVLTMTTQASAISARLPKVSYIKGIDVWMAACLLFVFGALIEYSVVNVLYRGNKEDIKNSKSDSEDEPHDTDKLCRDRHEKGDDIGDYGNEIREWQTSSGQWINLPVWEMQRLRENDIDAIELKNQRAKANNDHMHDNYHHEPHHHRAPRKRGYFSWLTCANFRKNKAVVVDTASRFLFPGLFMAFSLMYWILYGLVL